MNSSCNLAFSIRYAVSNSSSFVKLPLFSSCSFSNLIFKSNNAKSKRRLSASVCFSTLILSTIFAYSVSIVFCFSRFSFSIFSMSACCFSSPLILIAFNSLFAVSKSNFNFAMESEYTFSSTVNAYLTVNCSVAFLRNSSDVLFNASNVVLKTSLFSVAEILTSDVFSFLILSSISS